MKEYVCVLEIDTSDFDLSSAVMGVFRDIQSCLIAVEQDRIQYEADIEEDAEFYGVDSSFYTSSVNSMYSIGVYEMGTVDELAKYALIRGVWHTYIENEWKPVYDLRKEPFYTRGS